MAIVPFLEDPVREGPGFSEATGAALLIGRLVPFRGLGEQLLARWDRFRTVLSPLGDDVRIVAAHDLSRFGEYVGFDGVFRLAVGVTVATVHADDGPSDPFDREAIARAEERASAWLAEGIWDVLAAEISTAEAWSLRTQRTRALVVPFGPIASATLAYGALARGTDLPGRGLQRVRGTDMRARPHARAVHGVVVASAADWDVAEADVTATAHATRAFPGAAYHLVADYG